MQFIGQRYQAGRGVDRDPVQAVHWYRKAAEAGNDIALGFLERMARDGRAEAIAMLQRQEQERQQAGAFRSDGYAHPGLFEAIYSGSIRGYRSAEFYNSCGRHSTLGSE